MQCCDNNLLETDIEIIFITQYIYGNSALSDRRVWPKWSPKTLDFCLISQTDNVHLHIMQAQWTQSRSNLCSYAKTKNLFCKCSETD